MAQSIVFLGECSTALEDKNVFCYYWWWNVLYKLIRTS